MIISKGDSDNDIKVLCKVSISGNTNVTESFPGTVADSHSQHRVDHRVIQTSTSVVAPPDLIRFKCDNPSPEGLESSRTSNGLKQSEEHTSELQSRPHLVCRLLLEKKT